MITADAVAIGTGVAAQVPRLTMWAAPGTVAVLPVEGDDRPMHVSLLLAGRLAPDSGRVTSDVGELRRRVALVDTPVVAEPSGDLRLSLIVAEELVFAGRPSGRAAVRRFLAQHRLQAYAAEPFRALPAADRIRLLCELALARDGVDALVVTSPERHGGDPEAWFPALAAMASARATVVVVTDLPTARQLELLGARDATAPLPTLDSTLESLAAS